MSPPRTRAFTWLYTICCLLFTFGLFLDGWAHNHLASSLETFFTPWHGAFYAGFTLSALTLVVWTLDRKTARGSFLSAIPEGYALSMAGVIVFFFGGFGDMVWHILFGIETNIDALLSPTHLLLASGAWLMVSGETRHQWRMRQTKHECSWTTQFPLVLSLALTGAILVFMTQFSGFTQLHAAGLPPRASETLQVVSVLSILLFSAIIVGVIGSQLRHQRLPFGAVTFVLAGMVMGVSLMRYGTEYVPAALIAGLVGDLVLEYAPQTVPWRRIFCFLLPCSYYFLVFLTLLAVKGVWWSVHMWTGSMVYGGFAGLLVSALLWPPRAESTVRT